MKNCKDCSIAKELHDYYIAPTSPDGHVNRCKECTKAGVRANRANKIEYYRDYDRSRNMSSDRVKARREYIITDAGKDARRKAAITYRNKFPNSYRAKIKFGNALRANIVERQYSCSKCSSDINVEGHHDDYSKPLEVRWLCSRCHKLWHKTNTPLNRK